MKSEWIGLNRVQLNRSLKKERTYWTKNKDEADGFARVWNAKVSKSYRGIYFIYVPL